MIDMNSKNKNMNKPYVLAVIPARGGSKSIKDKNIRYFAGKPLIAHTIEAAAKSNLITRTIVSTDSEKIAEVARRYNADIPFLRPKNIAEDTTPMYKVLQHAIQQVEKEEHIKVDIVVLLDCTAPFRITNDIDICIKKIQAEDANTVMTLSSADRNPYFNMVEYDKQGKYVKVIKPTSPPITRRQDAPEVYNITSSVYASRRDFLFEQNRIIGEKTMGVVIPHERAGHIDDEMEFQFFDHYARKGGLFQNDETQGHTTKGLQIDRLFSLDGKVAFVTGATGILGEMHCHTLAAAGAHVIVTDVDKQRSTNLADELNLRYKNKALAFKTDLTNEKQIKDTVKAVIKRFGKIDILLNNAAAQIKGKLPDFEEFPLHVWNNVMSVNITGMFLCAREIIPIMEKQGGGSIINVASIYGLVGPQNNIYKGTDMKLVGVYSASKGAVVNFTRYLATSYGKKNIRVNTLSPGGVRFKQDPKFIKAYALRTPLGRMAERDDFAGALLFLASDASRYVTGANIIVDGGWTAW
jgi:NAD(P)-dependent dehydrogenase (short-subunit alcohol dehydrogenase family)/CMP-N-acetylneuraminic acid synthetase